MFFCGKGEGRRVPGGGRRAEVGQGAPRSTVCQSTVHGCQSTVHSLPVYSPQFASPRSTVCQSKVHSLPVHGPKIANPRSERAVLVILPRQEGAVQRCLGNSPELWRRVEQRFVVSEKQGRRCRGCQGDGLGRRGPGRRGPSCRNSGADAEIRGVDGGVAGCRGCEDHADVVRSRISKASRTSTMPKGAGWKTPMVPRVLMMSMMSEGTPDEMVGRDRHRF